MVSEGTISLVGSALKIAGEQMQSHMILALDAGLSTALGTFFYMVSAMAAVFIVAIGGQYKHTFYLLISPAFFFWLVSSRVEINDVNWRFGNTRYESAKVFEAVGEVTSVNGNPLVQMGRSLQVPWFYAEWDRFTSGLMQLFIEQFKKLSANKTDLTFIGKVDRYVALFGLDIEDPQLKFFSNISLVNRCSRYFTLLQYLNSPTYRDSIAAGVAESMKQEVQRIETEAVLDGSTDTELQSWARQVGITLPVDRMLSCRDLWRINMEALRPEAEKVINQVVMNGLPPGLSAKEALDKLTAKFGKTNVGSSDLVEIVDADPDAAYQLMLNEIAARLLVRQFKQLDPVLATHGVDRHNPYSSQQEFDDQNAESAQAARGLSHIEEWTGKGDFISAALTLPYVQGLVLFFLSMMFPFFAMALVVPGKHGVFLQWLGLFVWAKSWDVGFTIVMLIDEILYELFPHGPPIQNSMVEDPAAVFKTVLQVDPIYHANMYYNLIAGLMGSVPLLTAVLVRKGSDDIIENVTAGFKKFAARLGSSMAGFQSNAQGNAYLARIAKNVYRSSQRSMAEALRDPEVQAGLLVGHLGFPAAQAALGEIGKNGLTAKVLAPFAGATAAQALAVAGAKIDFIFDRNIREETSSDTNIRYSWKAVQDKWYSHDGLEEPPSGSLLSLYQARINMNVAGGLNAAMNDSVKRALTAVAGGAAHAGTAATGVFGDPHVLNGLTRVGGAAAAAAGADYLTGGTPEQLHPNPALPEPLEFNPQGWQRRTKRRSRREEEVESDSAPTPLFVYHDELSDIGNQLAMEEAGVSGDLDAQIGAAFRNDAHGGSAGAHQDEPSPIGQALLGLGSSAGQRSGQQWSNSGRAVQEDEGDDESEGSFEPTALHNAPNTGVGLGARQRNRGDLARRQQGSSPYGVARSSSSSAQGGAFSVSRGPEQGGSCMSCSSPDRCAAAGVCLVHQTALRRG